MTKTRTFKRIIGAVTAAALSLTALSFKGNLLDNGYDITASATDTSTYTLTIPSTLTVANSGAGMLLKAVFPQRVTLKAERNSPLQQLPQIRGRSNRAVILLHTNLQTIQRTAKHIQMQPKLPHGNLRNLAQLPQQRLSVSLLKITAPSPQAPIRTP